MAGDWILKLIDFPTFALFDGQCAGGTLGDGATYSSGADIPCGDPHDVEVVGSTGWPRPLRVHGRAKVRLLVERGSPPPWSAVYSDSTADLPLFAGTRRPVLVNAPARAAALVGRVLGTPPATRTWA